MSETPQIDLLKIAKTAANDLETFAAGKIAYTFEFFEKRKWYEIEVKVTRLEKVERDDEQE